METTTDLSMTDSVVSPALLSSVLVSAIGDIVEEAQWVTKLEVIVSFSLELLETTLVSDSRSVTCGWRRIGEIVRRVV